MRFDWMDKSRFGCFKGVGAVLGGGFNHCLFSPLLWGNDPI